MNLDVLTLESAHWDNTEAHLCEVAGETLLRKVHLHPSLPHCAHLWCLDVSVSHLPHLSGSSE